MLLYRTSFGPCRHGYHHIAMVTIISAWLPSYCHGYHGIGMVTMISAWSPWYRHDYYYIAMVTNLSPWLPSHQHGYHQIAMVTIILAWLPSYCDGYHYTAIVTTYCHGYHHGCSSTAPACNWELDRGFSCCTLAVAMTMRRFSHQCCQMKRLACPALVEKQNNEGNRENNCQNISIVII